MSTLDLVGLRKRFAERDEGVTDVSVTVGTGERFVLLGPSGSGKSTLVRLVAGLLDPDAGDVRLDGTSLRRVPAQARDFGVVFQDPLLFPHLSVAENVAFGLRARRVPARQIREAVMDTLAAVGLAGLERRRPHQLSGGQAQRVALARALVIRPRVLLLDEPFSALDTPLRRELRAWLVELQERTRTTLLLVTHDQEEAMQVAHRLGLLLRGRLAQVGAPRELFTRPASVEVARFFGGTNFIPGAQRGRAVDTTVGTFQSVVGREGAVIVTLRPEAFQLAASREASALRATVLTVDFEGTHQRVTLDVAGTTLIWHAPPHVTLDLGSEVWLTVPFEACWTLPAASG